MLTKIPAPTRQLVVAKGRGPNSPDSNLMLYRRNAAGWHKEHTWPAHNALHGWAENHRSGDLRSPVGVFTLTDAGGLFPDPGTKLPYTQSQGFAEEGTGFDGESLADAFDYVIAINYNRKVGVSPLDWTRPMGAAKGGGIWLHVDHGGPSHGCITVSREHMKDLLRTLEPALHPRIVMGDAAALKR